MSNNIEDLIRIMAILRDSERGCPWDIEQNFDTIAPYTIEEAYEVADAIDRHDYTALCEELGDLLLQVVFHSRMAQEAGHFDFADVVVGICDKMVRRHPHVFADEKVENADAQRATWERHKQRERANKGDPDTSLLAGIPRGLPEWQRALKLQKRAARVGFDWPDPVPVLEKLYEELNEVQHELGIGADPARMTDEIGDVLFVCVNLARLCKVDFSQALRSANAKFERRFRRMETLVAAEGTTLNGKPLAEQDTYWNRAKAEDKAGIL